jgi:hypothetical protein
MQHIATAHQVVLVRHPYPEVRCVVANGRWMIEQAATAATADLALRARHAGVEVRGEAGAQITEVIGGELNVVDRPTLALLIRWQAEDHPTRFPTIHAILSIYPIGPQMTHVELSARYATPRESEVGFVDRVAMRRMTAAVIATTLRQVGELVRGELARAIG